MPDPPLNTELSDQTPVSPISHTSLYTEMTDDHVVELEFQLTLDLNPAALATLDIKELTRKIAECITDAHDQESLLGHDPDDGMVPDDEDIASLKLTYLTQRKIPL